MFRPAKCLASNLSCEQVTIYSYSIETKKIYNVFPVHRMIARRRPCSSKCCNKNLGACKFHCVDRLSCSYVAVFCTCTQLGLDLHTIHIFCKNTTARGPFQNMHPVDNIILIGMNPIIIAFVSLQLIMLFNSNSAVRNVHSTLEQN